MAITTSRVRRPVVVVDSQTPPPAPALWRPQDGSSEWPPRPQRLRYLARRPDRRGDVAITGEGSSFNDSSAAGAAWVVIRRCAGSAKSIVNSDASSLLYRSTEDHHL